MKYIKKLIGILMGIVLCMSGTSVARAADTKENIVVTFSIAQIPTEYSTDDYYVVYDMGENENYAYIYEKNTDILIGDYAEIISQSNARYVGEQTVQVYSNFYASAVANNITKLRALVTMRVYTEMIGSKTVHTILGIIACDQNIVGEGPCYIESKTTSENRHTTTYCDVNCSGVLKTESTTATVGGVEIGLLENLGFSITTSSSSTWVARLAYNTVVRVEVIH